MLSQDFDEKCGRDGCIRRVLTRIFPFQALSCGQYGYMSLSSSVTTFAYTE